MAAFKYIYLILICLTGPLLVYVYQRLRLHSKLDPKQAALTKKPGHLKPFGCCTKRSKISTVNEWPKPKDFFEKYVWKRKPLLIRNGAHISPAFKLWTDDYFLETLEVPEGSTVNIESGKKEVRGNPVEDMNFKDWVRVYNNSDKYMVHDIPPYLGKDVVYPPSVQCDGLSDMVVTGVMWFSSGGTKSVVHTDGADNLNCLYRGEKTLIFVDPDKYMDKVPIDRLDGAYSSMDVDSVDYLKYPGMAEVEFYHAKMTAGDCLFIPRLWIHQVNSFGSNLAVNLWWDHDKCTRLDLSKCPEQYDQKLTMDRLKFPGFSEYEKEIERKKRKEWEEEKRRRKEAGEEVTEEEEEEEEDVDEPDLTDELPHQTKSAMSFDDFVEEMVDDQQAFSELAGVGYLEPLKQIFHIMDKNGDGLVRGSEFDTFTPEEHSMLNHHLQSFLAIRNVVEQDLDADQTGKDEL